MKKLILLAILGIMFSTTIHAQDVMTLCCGNDGAKIVFEGKDSCSCRGGNKDEIHKYWVDIPSINSTWGYCDLCEYMLSQHPECMGDPKRFEGNVDCPSGVLSTEIITSFPTWVSSPLGDASFPVENATSTMHYYNDQSSGQTTTVYYSPDVQNPASVIKTYSPTSGQNVKPLTVEEKRILIQKQIIEIQKKLIELITELINILSKSK